VKLFYNEIKDVKQPRDVGDQTSGADWSGAQRDFGKPM